MEYEDRINEEDLPIYKKGREIFKVVRHIGDLIPEDNKHLQFIKSQMFLDAGMLTAKIARVQHHSPYDMKMESATIIRMSARELMITNHSLEMFGFKDVEYFDIVRDLIEEYRLLFIEWVKRFDTNLYFVDRWGLFNPPGVGPFDEDPDIDWPAFDDMDDED